MHKFFTQLIFRNKEREKNERKEEFMSKIGSATAAAVIKNLSDNLHKVFFSESPRFSHSLDAASFFLPHSVSCEDHFHVMHFLHTAHNYFSLSHTRVVEYENFLPI